ncbi:MAG: gliding motility-associated C-terminal domain-containing protein [Chitinophagaceae bacterium]|nr:gliding motility-associated C-terminal domain-containing protein [Chitinophagaceae bacterium]
MRLSIIPVILLLTLTGGPSAAQTCGTDRLTDLLRRTDPDYDRRMQDNNLIIRDYIRSKFSPATIKLNGNHTGLPEDSVYTIPVVVHVIYPKGQPYGTGTNISYAQIRSQLEALNAAFSRSYPTYNGQSHSAYAQNAKIRFCLARQGSGIWSNGPGGTEYGVMRYPDSKGAYNHEMTFVSARQLTAITHPTTVQFPFDRYLNIWVVSSINGGNNIMGYAQLPGGGYPLDGIVMRADVFGDNSAGSRFPLGFNLMQGKVLAHEVGHYLNLQHIFNQGCSGTNAAGAATDACDLYGDYVCDTRPSTTENVSCNATVPNTCTVHYDPGTSEQDMINDYMSYADDDCMNSFTHDQVQRMWATLQLERRNLWQAENLVATGVLGGAGCVAAYLNGAISLNSEALCAGKPIRFSNPKAGNTATTRQWKFTGGTPLSAGSDTVSVVYNTPGDYTAVLTVSDAGSTIKDSLRFTVLSCQLDSSLLYMSNWYFGEYCSVDFSSGTAVKTLTALNKKTIHSESVNGEMAYMGSSISLSDSLGNLLFYTNGVSIWNSNHVKITSGPIFGPTSNIHWSSGLSCIPFPGHPGKYFIVGAATHLDFGPEGIRFVMLDLNAGTVTPYQEFSHPLLPPRFSMYVTVVPHCNGTDYWIIVRGRGAWDFDYNFYSFKVTSAGLDPGQEPVISTGFTSSLSQLGSGYQLKANRAGDKLFQTCSPNALYDFDSRTGKVSNEQFIPPVVGYNEVQSGASFSPNGEYIFIMRSSDPFNQKPFWLFQYRVSDLKYNIIPTTGFYFSHPFQLGPDNQLYILNTGIYLARLSDPDKWGAGRFDEEYISLRDPTFTMKGSSALPSFTEAKRKEPWHPDFSFVPTDCRSYTFSALCFDNYTATWDFGDGTPPQTGHSLTHTYTASGEFRVTLSLSSSTQPYGSVSKKVLALPTTIGISGPDSICAGKAFTNEYFAPANPGADYKWSVLGGAVAGRDDGNTVAVDWSSAGIDSGILYLTVKLGKHCILSAARIVQITTAPVFDWALPDSVCITAKSIVLNASPTGGNFKGPGVNNGFFSPDSAGLGNHILTYAYGSGNNCYSEMQKLITVYGCTVASPPPVPVGITDSISIPNIFSPNGDGINDTWQVPFLHNHPDAVVSVYNRGGVLVFKSTGYARDWDGNRNGKPLPVGTYYYVILLPGQKPISGSISILR